MMKINCGCTTDSLCLIAKKLWKCKSYKYRKMYSDHRRAAFGETELDGMQGISYRANNSIDEKIS